MKLIQTLFLLTIFAIFAQAQAAESQVDLMPYFDGVSQFKQGSVEKRNESNKKIIDFLKANLVYPDSAKANGIEGTVFLRFTVDEQGIVRNPRLLYDIGYGCGEEAMRIVNMMPVWEAALLKGEPVAVDLDLPVKFEAIDDSVLEGYLLVWGDLDGAIATKKRIHYLLEEPITALDEKGNVVDLLELKVAVVKNDVIIKEGLSDGHLTKRQKRMMKWLRPSQLLEIIGTVQKQGKFYYIHKELKCEKCFYLHLPFL